MSKAAKLPALPRVQTNDVQLQRWMQAVAERLEVREGSRGDPDERVVTHREMKTLGLDASQFSVGSAANQAGGVLVQAPNGGFTRIPLDAFSDQLRKTKLYQDLMKRIDDATRFDDVPTQVRSILLTSIAEEAAARGADIRRLEFKQQSDLDSLAYTVESVTASVAGVAAGVRETTYASATANAATAGRVTQVQARLDNFVDGTAGVATIEQKMTTSATRADGLSAQYTLKVGTGNKIAGIGLASATNTAGVGTSAIIFQADKFALVGPSETIADPANPPVSRVPFGYDSGTNTIYINGNVRINAGGQTISTMALPGAPGTNGTAGTRGSVTRYGSGTWADATANSLLPSLPAVIGDTVTISNTTSATTKYWSGSSWVAPGVVIDGNLLVSGTLSADKINAGTLSGVTINATTTLTVATASYNPASGETTAAQISTNKSFYNGAIIKGYAYGVEAWGGKYGGYFVCDGGYTSVNTGLYGQATGTSSGGNNGTGVYGLGGYIGVRGSAPIAGLFDSGAVSTQVASVGGGGSYGVYTNALIRSTFAVGAPIVVDSTSTCTNLNANYLQGNLASAFATAGHNHSGTYAVAAHTSSADHDGRYPYYWPTDSGAAYASNGMNLRTSGIGGVQTRGSGNTLWIEAISDARLKQDIEPEALGLDFVKALKPVSYRLIARPGTKFHGFIAQDVGPLITGQDDALFQTHDNGMHGVDYLAMIGPLVNAVQNLAERITTLESA